jgi:ribosomal-protein-serine acetyltransferase
MEVFSLRVDDRTSIELLQQHRKEELYSLIDTNRDYLRQWLPWVDKRQSPEDFESIIPMWIKKYADNNGFDAGIRHDGKLVGMIGLHYIDWNNKITSIGYFIAQDSQGKGIITRCVRKLLTHIFDELKLNKVVIQCASENTKSRAIPERLGFTIEGISRDGQWLYDHYVDLVNYSLLRREWLNSQTC